MGSENNNKFGNNGSNRVGDSQSIIVAKGDGFILAYVIMFCFFITLALCGAYHIGKLTEKVILLEDVVLVNGIYKQIEKDK